MICQPTLNAFAGLSKGIQLHVRAALQHVFTSEDHKSLPEGSTLDVDNVQLHLPVAIGDFTDFSASKEHVLNAGEAILGKRFLPPGFLHFPIGYGGRASSIVVSGTPIDRPVGQFRDPDGDGERVVCEPSRAVDYELEVAAVIGKPVERGQRVRAADADNHIFGLVMLNDWSGKSSPYQETWCSMETQFMKDVPSVPYPICSAATQPFGIADGTSSGRETARYRAIHLHILLSACKNQRL